MCNRGGLVFNLGSVAVASPYRQRGSTRPTGVLVPFMYRGPLLTIPNTRVSNTIPSNLLCASHSQLRRIELQDPGSHEDLQGRPRHTQGRRACMHRWR